MKIEKFVISQTFEHFRQHAGNHGEVHKHARVTRRSTNDATCRGEEENGGVATANASQVRCNSSVRIWFEVDSHAQTNCLSVTRGHEVSAKIISVLNVG